MLYFHFTCQIRSSQKVNVYLYSGFNILDNVFFSHVRIKPRFPRYLGEQICVVVLVFFALGHKPQPVGFEDRTSLTQSQV